MTNKETNYLNRFTIIPFLIDLLIRNKLTLLNPDTWEDYNDRVTMELYKKKYNAKSIYALCLTDKRETIHHWNAFASGDSGCCIEFNREKLVEHISKIKNLTHGKTEYIKIEDLSNLSNSFEKLPYLKRDPYSPEQEYRIVVLSDQPQLKTFEVDISADSIRRITLSSKLSGDVFKSLKESLLKISPNFKGKISHSTLFNNTKWTNHFSKQNGS